MLLLDEMKKLVPKLEIAGFDISRHGLAEAQDEIKPHLFRYRAQDRYPYGDEHFDPVITLGRFHNLRLFELDRRRCRKARACRQGKNIMARGATATSPRQFNLECWGAHGRADPAHVRRDLALQSLRLHRRLRIHLFRMSALRMKIKTAKAAILAQSRQPLIVDEIALPDALDVGQVLVKILTPRSAAPRSTRSRLPRVLTSSCRTCSDTRPRGRCSRPVRV